MTIENSFLRYRETGDPAALGAVFDRLAPDLVLVAAHLAGSDAADDLVQATFLDAIEQRERWDPERPLAPWLVGLLGNHIRRARRLRARVPDPARLAARDVPASDAIAEARDTIAAVHAAVERLPRHYRAVLSLRLVRDLDLQAIANTLGLPLGTVKVRLHRGLELLRRTLPVGLAAVVAGLVASGPGLAAVRRAVLDRAEALPSSAVAAGAITTGIAIGGIYVKQWLFGVAVCALLAVGWFAVPPDGSAVAQAMVPSPPSPPAVATGEDPAAPVEPAGVGSDVPRREAVAPVDAATRPGAIAIVATWGSDGGPAAGVALSLHREGHAPVLAPQVGSAVTDERGQLVFDGLSPGSYRVSALLIGITPGEPIAVEAGRTAAVELALDGAIQLAIRVCDPAGVPCAGAEVYGVEPFQRGEPVRRLGTTTGDGRLFYRGVPLEYVFARRAGRTPSPTHRLPAARTGAASAAPTAVALTVGEPGCVLVGSVVDPEGRAVADARVAIAVVDEFGGEDDPAAIVVHTDAAGRFACDELPPGERNVMARRAGYGPAIARATTCADDTATITLALTAAASLAGSVTDARGAPVGGVNVRVGNGVPVTGIRWSASPMLATSTDAAGAFRLTGIAPGSATAIVEVWPSVAQSLHFVAGEELQWNVQLDPDGAIEGRVIGEDGAALAGWHVVAAAMTRPFSPSVLTATTGGDGRFRITGAQDVAHRLEVFPPHQRPAGPRDRRPRGGAETVRPGDGPITLQIARAALGDGGLAGDVLLPVDAALPVTIDVNGHVPGSVSPVTVSVELPVGASEFAIAALPPGEYELYCRVDGRGILHTTGVCVAAGRTARVPPFDLAAQRPVVLVLRQPDGRLATGADVHVVAGWQSCPEQQPGHYLTPPISASPLELALHGPDFAPETFVFAPSGGAANEHTVTPATRTEFVVEPPTPRQHWRGWVQVEVRNGAATPVLQALVPAGGGPRLVWPIGLPAGNYSVTFRAGLEGSATQRVTIGAASQRFELALAR